MIDLSILDVIALSAAEELAYLDSEECRERRKELARQARSDPSNIANWFSLIQNVVRVPCTVIYEISYEDYLSVCDRKVSQGLANVAKRIADWSLQNRYDKIFIKGGFFSGKYSWARSCYVDVNRADSTARAEKIVEHLQTILYENELCRNMPELNIAARELIDTSYAPFQAFEGMPIVAERRFWVDQGKLALPRLFHLPLIRKIAFETFTCGENFFFNLLPGEPSAVIIFVVYCV